MKINKLIPVIMAIGAACAVFAGCEDKRNKEYDELNAKLALDYSQIVLTVTNTIDEDTVLIGEYAMEFAEDGLTVTYSVERLSEVSFDSTTSIIVTLEGEAVVKDGKITSVNGDKVDLDVITVGTGLNFKEKYFANADLTGIYLMADVTNPSAFMGSELVCTNMKVKATFLEVFYSIQITYTAQNGNRVEYLYNFT